MFRLTSRRAALVLAASALALAGTILPAQAATTGWRVNATVVVHGRAASGWSVAAVSATDAWAAGLTTKLAGNLQPQVQIRHWNGKSWRLAAVPSKLVKTFSQEDTQSLIAASSTSNVWDFGIFPGGAYLRLSGKSWSIGTAPGTDQRHQVVIGAAQAFSSRNVWAFGERETLAPEATDVPYAARYDGHGWTRTAVPAPQVPGPLTGMGRCGLRRSCGRRARAAWR